MSARLEILQVCKMRDMIFEKLMCVYEEGNREKGQRSYPKESESEQIRLVKQDFYDYLRHDFFTVTGAKYWILQVDRQYACALRTEPFQDGYLLQALETAPHLRRRGYAGRLMQYVTTRMHEENSFPIYSHVSKKNTASLAAHKKCGFTRYKDCATYLDGTISSEAYTLVHRI